MANSDGAKAAGWVGTAGNIKHDSGAEGGTPTPFPTSFRTRMGANQLDGRGAEPSSQDDFAVPGVPKATKP